MQIEKNRKNRWQIEFNSETLTLTLGERGRRTYWVYASPMAALVRDRPAQPVSSGRGTGCSAARRRDAGAHARGREREAPSTASSTVMRSPTGERARRRASRGGAALASSAAAMAVDAFTLAAAAVVEREGGGKEMA